MKSSLILICFVVVCFCTKARSQNLSDSLLLATVNTSFPGGQTAYSAYISKNGNYPLPAFNAGIMGCSYIEFMIEKDGSLTHLRVIRSVGSGMDEEALRLIRESGKWLPVYKNNIPVRTICVAPVSFVLEDDPNKKTVGLIEGRWDKPFFMFPISETSNKFQGYELGFFIHQRIAFRARIHSVQHKNDGTTLVVCDGPNNDSTKQFRVLIRSDSLLKENMYLSALGFVDYVEDKPAVEIKEFITDLGN